MDQLDQSDFTNWLEHPITKALASLLNDIDEMLKQDMLSPAMVLSDRGLTLYTAAASKRELIEEILTLKIEDLIRNEEIENDE